MGHSDGRGPILFSILSSSDQSLLAAAEAPGAARQADPPAVACRPGFQRAGRSGLMPHSLCVMPRACTLCTMLCSVSACDFVQCLLVLAGWCATVLLVCVPSRVAAALRSHAWCPRQPSRPMSWWGGSRAPWARGMTWGGRIASRLCATRVRVRMSSREKNRGYHIREARVKVSEWYKCYWVVFSHPLGDSLRVGTL